MIDTLVSMIHFRNQSHLIWFILSMIFLVASILFFFLDKGKSQFVFFIFYHLGTLFSAFYVVIILKKPSLSFSVDCIWFNGTMAAVYYSLYFFASKWV